MDQEIGGRAFDANDLHSDDPHVPPLPHDGPGYETGHQGVTAVDQSLRDHAASNGHGGKLKEPTSLFWQQPIAADEEVNWFVPPLPRREEHGEQVVTLLNELDKMVPHMPMRAWLARWNYHTRSAASAAEQVDVEREAERRFAEQLSRGEVDARRLDEMIQALEAREQVIEGELTEAQKEFAEAAAQAGLSCQPDPHRRQAAPTAPAPLDKRLLAKSPSNQVIPAGPDPIADLNYAPSGINPLCVEDALQMEVPDLDAVAGRHGVSPIPRQTLWSTILTFFMQFLAPLVCGFMLALCLGTLVGILDLDDFSRRDSVPKFALAAALGFVIVYLMGELFSNVVHALTRTLEMKEEDDEASSADVAGPVFEDRSFMGRIQAAGKFRRPPAPRLRAGLGAALVLLCAALFLGFAEVTAEGYGIRELHHQQIARRLRFRNPNSGLPPEEELWMPLYLVIGTLISGPYLMYKASKSWGESDVQRREAWLLHEQRMWIDERRARSETGLAFQVACRVEQLETSLYDLKIQLKTLRERRAGLYNPQPDAGTQARRKEARAAAVGEALRLQTMIEEMVNITEPFPVAQSAATTRPSVEAPRPAGSRVTFTNR